MRNPPPQIERSDVVGLAHRLPGDPIEEVDEEEDQNEVIAPDEEAEYAEDYVGNVWGLRAYMTNVRVEDSVAIAATYGNDKLLVYYKKSNVLNLLNIHDMTPAIESPIHLTKVYGFRPDKNTGPPFVKKLGVLLDGTVVLFFSHNYIFVIRDLSKPDQYRHFPAVRVAVGTDRIFFIKENWDSFHVYIPATKQGKQHFWHTLVNKESHRTLLQGLAKENRLVRLAADANSNFYLSVKRRFFVFNVGGDYKSFVLTKCPLSNVYMMVISPDGQHAIFTNGLVGSNEGKLQIYNLKTHSLELETEHVCPLSSICYGMDGTLVGVTTHQNRLVLI